MQSDAWPFVPPKHNKKFGESPFGVRGTVFTGFLDYTERQVPGGLNTISSDLTSPQVELFLRETIFLATSTYDLEALMVLLNALSVRTQIPLARLIRSGSHGAAKQDVAGRYRAQLRSTSPQEMINRLPRIFMRYFEPCTSDTGIPMHEYAEMRFGQLPASALGFYVWAAEGFVSGALESINAKDVKFVWGNPSADGEIEGVPVQTITAQITWTNTH